MSRAALVTQSQAPRQAARKQFPSAGLYGRSSMAVPTEMDPRVQSATIELLERAREIRPVLREQQSETEKRGYYSQQVHDFFLEHGFYRTLTPLSFGGLELTVSAFYQVIAEVSRGCPSTGWCLSLSTGHSLTLGSYWSEATQQEVFGRHGNLIAPASGNAAEITVEEANGGYIISGMWRYCSGAPYSTHFMPTIVLPGEDGEAAKHWGIVPRADFQVLDDWGSIMGLRGSGSNSIRIDRAFVPNRMLSRLDWSHQTSGDTVGSALHGNPMYAGTFTGFSEGEVAATTVGLGYAALDAYEDILHRSKHPYVKDGSTRSEHEEWQRTYGVALAKVDAAAATLAQSAKLYAEYAKRSVEGRENFDQVRTLRLSGTYFVVEHLVWDAVESMMSTAGSSASIEGQPLQRYFRDMATTRTRTDQLNLLASQTCRQYFDSRTESGPTVL